MSKINHLFIPFILLFSCAETRIETVESTQLEIKRDDVTLRILLSPNQNIEITDYWLYISGVESNDTLNVNISVKGVDPSNYTLSGGGCRINKSGTTYLVILGKQKSFSLSVSQRDSSGAVRCIETYRFYIRTSGSESSAEPMVYDTTDCGFVYGLDKAINCAEIADNIIAYDGEWLENTNSTLFFERIKNNSYLKEINFCFVHVDSIPASIGTVKNLEILSICGGTINTIPKEIGNLKHLKELTLGTSRTECGGNKIVSLPSEIGECESLEFLGLAFSLLTDLPAELSKCKNLKTIDLYKNEGITLSKLHELKTRFPNVEFISHLE